LAVVAIAGLAVLLALLLWWWLSGGGGGFGTGSGPDRGGAQAAGGDRGPVAAGTVESAPRAATPSSATPAGPKPVPEPAEEVRLTSVAASEPPAPPSPTTARGDGTGGGLGVGDVSFRLLWRPPLGDFDLHVTDPLGHAISHNHRLCSCGGEMDRDDTTSGGPENVYWPSGKAPRGVYTFLAEWYAGAEPVTLTLQVYRGRTRVAERTARLEAKGQRTEAFTYRFE
jgi:hypothetical protein